MIAIAGAGIGGLTLAVALQRAGIECKVYERASKIDQVGAGLLLSPNATRLLDRLGVLSKVLPLGKRTNRWRVMHCNGTLLQEIRIPGNSAPGLSVHRADLQQVLTSMIEPASLQLGFSVDSFESTCDRVLLKSADGATKAATALVGADGLRSQIRKQLFGTEALSYAGYIGWRGVASYVPPGYSESLSEAWGPRARFGIAVLDDRRTYSTTSTIATRGAAGQTAELRCLAMRHIRWVRISGKAPVRRLKMPMF